MPSSRSLLMRGERWFCKIQRDLISRGIFTSHHRPCAAKIMSCIRLHNRNSRPFPWIYRDTKRRTRVNASPETVY